MENANKDKVIKCKYCPHIKDNCRTDCVYIQWSADEKAWYCMREDRPLLIYKKYEKTDEQDTTTILNESDFK